jgi:Fur family zinc uptake transcriptional regulator
MARIAASRSSAARATVPPASDVVSDARLTPIRQQVLSLLTRIGKSIGGYDLLRLYEHAYGRSSANTIYRTLRYLVGAGLVVYLPSTKTFVVRSASESAQIASAFLVCVDCGTVNESADSAIAHAVTSTAHAIGFRQTRAVEVEGICNRCQKRDAVRFGRHRNATHEPKSRRRAESRSHVQ